MASDPHLPEDSVQSVSPPAVSSRPGSTGINLAPVDWVELVRKIQINDPTGMELLHDVFTRGVRFYLAKRLVHKKRRTSSTRYS